ncbi:hypothetical protein KIPB_012209, partial [Kipferlia bialata]
YEIVPVEGKGLGIVATEAIKRGEVILQERPLFAIKDYYMVTGYSTECETIIQRALKQQTTPEEKEAFWALHDATATDGVKTAAGITRTNGMAGDGGSWGWREVWMP